MKKHDRKLKIGKNKLTILLKLKTFKEVAKELAVAPGTLRSYIRSLNIDFRKLLKNKSRKIHKKDLKKLLKEKSREEICGMLGIKMSTFNLLLKNYGLTRSRKLNILKAKEIRVLYETDKYTQLELADMYCVSEAMIWKIINDKVYYTPSFALTGSASANFSKPYISIDGGASCTIC